MEDTGTARDRRHESYDYWRYAGRDWHWFEGIFRRVQPQPPVLDVGSGLGFIVECCLHHNVRAVGLELSKEGTRASAARGVPVVRGDLSIPLPFRSNAFGTVIAHHVLEHVPVEMERRLLREAHRVLRPGGFLFAVSPSTYHPHARDDPDHINLFTVRQLATELEAAGFSKVGYHLLFWNPFWDPNLRLGTASVALGTLLWRIVPNERRVGVISLVAWK